MSAIRFIVSSPWKLFRLLIKLPGLILKLIGLLTLTLVVLVIVLTLEYIGKTDFGLLELIQSRVETR